MATQRTVNGHLLVNIDVSQPASNMTAITILTTVNAVLSMLSQFVDNFVFYLTHVIELLRGNLLDQERSHTPSSRRRPDRKALRRPKEGPSAEGILETNARIIYPREASLHEDFEFIIVFDLEMRWKFPALQRNTPIVTNIAVSQGTTDAELFHILRFLRDVKPSSLMWKLLQLISFGDLAPQFIQIQYDQRSGLLAGPVTHNPPISGLRHDDTWSIRSSPAQQWQVLRHRTLQHFFLFPSQANNRTVVENTPRRKTPLLSSQVASETSSGPIWGFTLQNKISVTRIALTIAAAPALLASLTTLGLGLFSTINPETVFLTLSLLLSFSFLVLNIFILMQTTALTLLLIQSHNLLSPQPAQKRYKSILTLLWSDVLNIQGWLTGLVSPEKKPPGFIKVGWECCCCHRKFTDIVKEKYPGAARVWLDHLLSDQGVFTSPHPSAPSRVDYPRQISPLNAPNSLSTEERPASRGMQNSAESRLDIAGNDGLASVDGSYRRKYINLCFRNIGKLKYKGWSLVQDEISENCDDQAMLRSMAMQYNSWSRKRWYHPRRLHRIEFTRFRLYSSCDVAIEKSDIGKFPSKEECNVYDYECNLEKIFEIPSMSVPPSNSPSTEESSLENLSSRYPPIEPAIPRHMLMHFFRNTECRGTSRALREAMPKTKCLKLSTNFLQIQGWGLRFKERSYIPRIVITPFCIIAALVALVIASVYTEKYPGKFEVVISLSVIGILMLLIKLVELWISDE